MEIEKRFIQTLPSRDPTWQNFRVWVRTPADQKPLALSLYQAHHEPTFETRPRE